MKNVVVSLFCFGGSEKIQQTPTQQIIIISNLNLWMGFEIDQIIECYKQTTNIDRIKIMLNVI